MLWGWELCNVLQSTSLHGNFLEVGGQPNINLTHSVTSLPQVLEFQVSSTLLALKCSTCVH